MTAIERKKIALVEDAADTTEFMTVFLNNLCDDFELYTFSTGSAFLNGFRTGVYRAVILDISLPEMDGYEVLRKIRLIDAAIPVIAFTAHAGLDYRQRAIAAGFIDVVTKPLLDLEAFCRTIIEVAA